VTLTTLTTAVETRVNDDTSPTYSSAEITGALNAGQLVFCFLTLCYEKTATASVAQPFVHALALATDYIVPLRLKGAAKLRPATVAEFDALNPLWWASANPAARYAARGDLLFFDGAISSLTFTYAAAPPALASGSDVPVIPAEYHTLLADYAGWRLLLPQSGQELEKGKQYIGRFLAGAQELAGKVRARSLAQHYDTLPPEREAFDVSRLMKQLPRKERPEWTQAA
jgi:hypothetical protein